MNLYPAADDKREMGESVLSFDVRRGMEWLESAAAQDAGTLNAYKRAVKDWEANKPRARDFVPDEVRKALQARETAEIAKANAEFQATWGSLLASHDTEHEEP